MKNFITLLFLCCISVQVMRAQCVIGTPCNDNDTCTTNDQITGYLAGTPVVCGLGDVEIPNPGTVPETYSRILTAAEREYVSPFLHNSNPPTGKRWRQQFMFLRSELDVELNQVNGANGTPSPNSINGIGTCQPITAIGFWVDSLINAPLEKTWTFEVSIKHAPLGVNNLFAGFDYSSDPSGTCVASAILTDQPAVQGGPAWVTFSFGAPFVWDGVRNIIIEVAAQSAGPQTGNRVLPVKYSVVPGADPDNQLTYAVVVPSANWGVAACNPAAAMVCGVAVIAAALPAVAACATTAGSINLRPVVRFTGGVTAAPPATCLCAGTAIDSDGDGIPDCTDNCPNVFGEIGSPCDDGDPNTTNDTINGSCECAGIALGISETKSTSPLRAWPIPCSSTLFLDRAVDGAIIDPLGRVMGVIHHSTELNVSHLSSGVYLLRTFERGIVRFVKE